VTAEAFAALLFKSAGQMKKDAGSIAEFRRQVRAIGTIFVAAIATRR
jgi:hypothetical protein